MHPVRIRAVADPRPDLKAVVEQAANQAASVRMPVRRHSTVDAKHAGPVLYRDWRTMIEDPIVGLVSIATPPYTHAEIACAAMQAGKHVLIEKPMATTREDAERIIEVQEETGRVAGVDYMLRFNPIVEVLQGWARKQPFGPLRRVVVENYAQDEDLPRDHWFWLPERSGGILVEHAVHFIDVVHGCTDFLPTSVESMALRREDGRIDRMAMHVVYADELLMHQYHEFSRPGYFEDTSLRFVFDLAQVDVHGWIPLSGMVTALVSSQTETYLHQLPGLSVEKRVSVKDAENQARPDGWGGANSDEAGVRSGDHSGVRSGGRAYDASSMVSGRFALPVSKGEAYAAALQRTMADVVAAIRDPNHRLRSGLAEGMRSLDVALTATARALQRA